MLQPPSPAARRRLEQNRKYMIYHITTRTAWDEAQTKGEYTAPSLAVEGFIHCSTKSQVLPVAENFYKGQTGLILLVIDPSLLSSTLRWELPSERVPSPSGVAQGEKFPHIYGPLNSNAVVKVVDLESGINGKFQLPPSLNP
jgi:uncharacterized protein (DUF952 family)